ncbi:thiamine-phosphate kinase [Luteimonas sp. A482]
MEFDLIARIRDRAATRPDVVLGIGDDAALLQPPPGMQLAVSMDTLNAGVHFPAATAPADIGWKSLAVNLSDLAAMGAQPAWCTLSLSLPGPDPTFVDGFLDGFLALARQHQVALVGGDTTRGPLSICVAVHGLVAPDAALRRDAARAGDDIWVTGSLGDAAGALAAMAAGAVSDRSMRTRLDRPTPRIEAGRALGGLANACIDVSDGLLADLGHVCFASGVGARIELAALPASPALARFGAAVRWPWQASGGDDYELCFTAPPDARDAVEQALREAATPVSRIGAITAGQRLVALDLDGQHWQPPRGGYAHFA